MKSSVWHLWKLWSTIEFKESFTQKNNRMVIAFVERELPNKGHKELSQRVGRQYSVFCGGGYIGINICKNDGQEANFSHALQPKSQNRSNAITNSIKALKMIHIKQNL